MLLALCLYILAPTDARSAAVAREREGRVPEVAAPWHGRRLRQRRKGKHRKKQEEDEEENEPAESEKPEEKPKKVSKKKNPLTGAF